tara:strand:+ start:2716 stop:3660 length:945 start_codon:yes stop_codon:yes gene_type:complete
MALAINGTTGISGVDGSASAPAIVGSDSNTGFSFASDTVNINTGGTSRVNIDSSGHLNMPTDSGQIRLGASQDLLIFHDSNNSVIRETGTGSLFLESDTNIFLGKTNGGEKFIKCEPDGTVELYFNDNLKLSTRTDGITLAGQMVQTSTSARAIALNRLGSAGEMILFDFQGTKCGAINVNTNSTEYATSSDYRLKENLVSISDGITRLKTLKTYRFNWIGDTSSTRDGFLAHEVSSIVPEAISGTKDQIETTYYEKGDNIPEGKSIGDVKSTTSPVYQGIDQSKLVPLLTAALQEAVGKIETLETKVAALEAG